MSKEGIWRGDSKHELTEQLNDDLLERAEEENRFKEENKRLLEIEQTREQAMQPSQDQFHTFETLMSQWDNIASRYEIFGYENATLVGSPIVTIDKHLIAIAVKARNSSSQQMHHGWITMEFGQDRIIHYKSSIGNEVIDTVLSPQEFEGAWLQDNSESTKIVKSRPAFMYPELLDLPSEEVWPTNQDAKVLVVGDPYQACDREGVTIVEYEYADEMVPPILHNRYANPEHSQSTRRWLQDLHHEDTQALENMYGMYTPDGPNPYLEMVNQAFEACEELADKMSFNIESEHTESRRKKIKENLRKLINGDWTVEEALEITHYSSVEEYTQHIINDGRTFGYEHTEESLANIADNFESNKQEAKKQLENWHVMKSGGMDKLGNPEAWKDFVRVWNNAIEILENSDIANDDPDIADNIEQAKYWIDILPTATSSQRVTYGMYKLNDIVNMLMPYQSLISNTELENEQIVIHESIFNDNDNLFGYFTPGAPISLRTKKILTEALRHIESVEKYHAGLLPNIIKEEKRLEELGVPLTDQAAIEYFRGLEQAWAKQHLFEKRTQKAVPIHGFFPYNMPEVDQQDRILALTSVSMHGWNNMRGDQFKREVELSLPSLKVGGKYILGPINQHMYFGGHYSNFDAEGLTESLQDLASAGVISYEFVKGVRDYGNGERDDEMSYWDANNQILHEDESASSLVITRLK